MSNQDQIEVAKAKLRDLPPQIDDTLPDENTLDDRTEQIKRVADATNPNSWSPLKRIKILMLQHDISQTFIVTKYGFDRGDVSKVVHFKRKTPAIRAAIANEIGLPVEDVFRK